ncbi:MAG: undecaprenyl-diphosphate phosphatase [Paludibacterium sp.]|uniref:undecaprenyl-diphosphate phosphatase n=1 Tax=Paludibacterium sp. TaxID=1917523 RepID=UPI0025DDEBD9|nr:undecaprenyl-diphosphate phosphatase [Paludibacterium sp.]MBV8045524.1 undecaprenyl-diphosphate phosphatase [Paludibacterium sp.]MBV8647981.1 undecaprenyl-diphosphate phosphatase [Paludibacterium sp.]
MSTLHAILFAIMQGISELFPVSSLGHGVILPDLLHWNLDRQDPSFLAFMVMLHLGTALALFIYFYRDWLSLLGGFIRAGGRPVTPESRLVWLLIAGTVPAGLIGLLLEKKLRALFGSTTFVLAVLIVNGIILIAGDMMRQSGRGRTLDELSFFGALKIGLVQALALIPGISRSGVTLIAGLRQGLSYAASARFAFLLATPIIGAAGVLEVPKLLHEKSQIPLSLALGCGLLSGFFAYLSTWVLMRYFNKHEIQALRPFGWYCIGLGLVGLLLRLL